MRPSVTSALRALVILVALAAAGALLASGPGYRAGWWHFRVGISLVRWSAYLGVAALVLSAIAMAVPRLRATGPRLLTLALVLSLGVTITTLTWAQRAWSVPRIHDISTDTDNPPQFAAVLPLRTGAENKPEYDGKEVAELQKKAYPDIQTLELAVPKHVAWARARTAAQELGWQIVSSDPAAGRVEAVDTTGWFGFKDDIVVRIVTTTDGVSRVDVRSKSRVGRSDIGTNARRIRAFLDKLRVA